MLDWLAHGMVGPSLFAESQRNFHIDVLSIAQSHVHVMHALLAASALHIRFRSNPSLTQPPPRTLTAALASTNDDFAVVEAGHHLSATAGFRTALSSLSETTQIDPLLTTCMLLNMLSFAGLPEAEDDVRRWPFLGYGGEQPLHWLRIQLGFAPLMGGLSIKAKRGSAWLAFFEGLDHNVLYDERDGTEGVPEAWCAFWAIRDDDGIDGHRYLRVVRRLVSILAVWESVEAGNGATHDGRCLQYLQFMQGVDEAFICRLEARDAKALVVYGWFMAILTYTNHWWCRSRAVRECTAVVRYLDETYGAALDDWLGFMAKAVGYELKGSAIDRFLLEL
ncbi:uncharacterized protein HMPREF1541_05033 [Cyphellophora europaea CBS 101466]|uniref:Transcription factor domain-containing protein n=1 Tax=Cyphellophora europaea (strain CBS 101466) TaxID=1220924 RepID=W2RY83_CYPE1|nr:uncharacterized protein HMPREF1541_05033 [Cyphellophora europaea CBS 101466]ETN40753.1 hypothetical protein HMPREF1541_05033 [Cyphellophora europaea CBS 101466]